MSTFNNDYKKYTESETVKQLNTQLQNKLSEKPNNYQSQWQGKTASKIDSILNRDAFSYDVNGDALYQQYKDQYTSLGKLAMQDTMGQAAALTGGYGSSYASAVGNQAYQSYLSQLNDVVPELYGMALDKYMAEGNELYNQYSLLANQENQDYGRYMDEYNTYLTERDYLTGRYDSERTFDYGEYRDAISDEQWQKQYDESIRQYNEQFEYAKERDKVSDSQYTEQFEYAKERDKVSDSQYATTAPKYITDTADIQEWSDIILNAKTRDEALRYVERLEQLDPTLADSLWKQYLIEESYVG